MEKNNKQQDDAKKITPQEGAESLDKKPVERSKSILVWLAIVILLGLIAGSFWFMQQQLKKLEVPAVTDQSSSIEQLENEVSHLSQTVMDDKSALEQRLAALTTANVSLLEKVDNLANIKTLTNDDLVNSWRIAEIKFLLQTANQSAVIAANVGQAEAALTLADQQVKLLNDPRFHELRALISDEQLALSSIAKVDVDGLAIQLQSALKNIEQLQILMGPQIGEQARSDSAVTSSSSWDKALSQVWQQIKSLVVIRHQEDAAAAVLVPEQRYFLYQNLNLKLESARLALLSGREVIFHDSLDSAVQWLQHYFIGVERDAMLELLTAMQSQTITIDIPDISASLIWLQQYEDGAQQ